MSQPYVTGESPVPATGATGVTGVVTAYRPTTALIGNVESLREQVDAVVVVDDGGGPGFEPIFAALTAAGAEVLRLPENAGIGAALNAGIRAARQHGNPDFILTVDQDSLLPAGYVQELRRAAAEARAANVEPGLISPSRIHGNPVLRAGTRNGVALGREPIQSGLLIPAGTLDAIGGFWEELFIDLVDTEYYYRALAAGLPTVLAAAEFDHSLGTMVEAEVFGWPVQTGGRPLQVRTAATWRYYYIFRNRIVTARRYAVRYPAWVAGGMWGDLRHLLIVTLLAPGRAARLGSALRGTADGLRGRTGRRHSA